MSQPQRAISPPQGTLLLIEPDVLARTVLADYLRGCGYVVHEVSTAEEALAVLQGAMPGEPIEFVVSEIHGIGSMTGFELAHAIRDSHPDLDVILASSQTNAAQKCHELCEHRTIKKPFSPEDLMRHIHLLRQKRRGRTKARRR
ncbi:MAG TPA: response regulator [Steroidobacteraceae bacterium]|jgi:CheY-like chemotaxis protein